jgi:molybdenum cofactor biosynthesis protein B
MARSVRAAVVTVSDRVARGEGVDKGGPRVVDLLEASGRIEVLERVVVADERPAIRDELLRLAAAYDLVVTTGGTGLAPRDVTPEATADVVGRRLPGMEEAMRAAGRAKTPLAVLSRAIAGTCGSALVLNLPGSPSGIEDGLGAVLASIPHAVEVLRAEVADCAPARAKHEPPQ